MGTNDFEAKIRNRVIKFPAVDGLSPIEQSTIVGQVEEKINKIEEKLNIVDSSKLAILAAYDFAVELYNLKQRSETNREADSKKVEEMVERLERTLAAAAPEEK
jgi:cell division protein ZapA (FtsZ GTPase activity inhibitor)